MQSIPVRESIFKELFEDIGDREVTLLGDDEADAVWNFLVENTASSYFDLPDSSWVVLAPRHHLGRWIDAYNSDDRELIKRLLKQSLGWNDRDPVAFMAKKSTILRTNWSTFCDFWDDFLAVEDDCPLLMRMHGISHQALLFRPVGDIVKIN
jgi:hypothetical protein